MSKKNEIRELLLNIGDSKEFSYIANFHTESIDDLLLGGLKINFDYSIDINSINRAHDVYKMIFNDEDEVYSTVLIYCFPPRILNKLYDLAMEGISDSTLECGIDSKYLYATIDLNNFEIRYNDYNIGMSYDSRVCK